MLRTIATVTITVLIVGCSESKPQKLKCYSLSSGEVTLDIVATPSHSPVGAIGYWTEDGYWTRPTNNEVCGWVEIKK